MPATLDHESFPQPRDPAVSLWRYMDLSKFAALLQSRTLVFPRTDHLGDPFEGSVPAPTARYYDAVRAIRASGGDDPLAGLPDSSLEELATHTSSARQKMIRSTYVSCWHMNAAESAAMWRLYSKSSDAVCIRTNYSTLGQLLPDKCFLGAVRYINFKTDIVSADNLLNPLMTKRRSFSHECEARAVIWDGERFHEPDLPIVKAVPIDLDQLVKSVYVSPEAPDWFRDVVAGLASTYGLAATIEHSEMNSVPLY